MTYEYSTQGANLDFPNPYRIENLFLALRGGLLLIGALVLLVVARQLSQALESRSVQAAALAPSLSLGLLIAGGIVLAAASLLDFAAMARQLRVFFGRGQPASLAAEVPRGASGTSVTARTLSDTLRQGAIALAEPHGAINGVLYSLAKDLITAPLPLRAFVQLRFGNAVAIGGLLLLFAVTQFISAAPNARALGAIVYVLLGAALILRSALQGGTRPVSIGPLALVGLLVFAVVGTVFVGRLATAVPDLAWLNLPAIALVLLAASFVVELLGLMAGLHHVDAPPPASTAAEQVATSFNADPNLLLQEIDRELQRRWTDSIPNRRYTWISPQIALTDQAGNFNGMVLEETQPMPPQTVGRMDWSACLAYPRFSRLALMDAVGVLATAVGTALWIALALRLQGLALVAGGATSIGASSLPWSFLSMGLILIVIGGYALRVAHGLWGRIDFESDLIWIELEGSYARARVDLGNPWADRVRSGRDVINVESMTLRAWSVRARSVLFDYRNTQVGSRVLVGMSGSRDGARNWVHLVRDFAQAQSSAVVPAASADAQRIAHLQGLNVAAGAAALPLGSHPLIGAAAQANAATAAAAAPASLSEADAAGPDADTAAADRGPATRFCAHCGQALGAGARFCPQCGKAASANLG